MVRTSTDTDDEPTTNDDADTVTVTTYTIGGGHTTTNARVAELCATDGFRVTASTERIRLATDGGRPPLSSFDHGPDVGASDVDKCRECGRYAPHAFDHAPDCSRFESIDA